MTMTISENQDSVSSLQEIGQRAVRILLVEDNPADVRLTREVFEHGPLHCEIAVAEDGERAMAYLQRRGDCADAHPPDMVLLDLNLPRKDGREVLAEIKADPALSRIPVIVLTSSSAESDVLTTYGLHANCYIVKPVNLDQFMAAVRGIESFWLSIAQLPPREKRER